MQYFRSKGAKRLLISFVYIFIYNGEIKTTFWKKVGPKLQPMEKKGSSEAGWAKNNLLKKGWAKNTTDGKKSSSEAGWDKN